MRHSKGFSLIEVMVTLVLTTIGILGMVAMQGRSIQYTQDSVQRNAAVMLAGDFVEIIRTNPEELFEKAPPAEPFYNAFKDNSLFYKDAGNDFATAPADCVANPKSALEMRDCWIKAAQAALPGASDLFEDAFYICRSSAPGNCNDKGSMLEIQLAWRVKAGTCPDDRASNDTTCIYRTRVEL
ncbi:type IV pilus modification protein PilV [Pseudomonas sp. BAY1663]|uniref:type IV pilus modification protein PilV n=1 Tax=Pseudomonas sp. BAY1663 TaxID=1439940 RepID=UPI00042DF1BA|nr:type IV pilus modification protein PilV [Pseudomonas sp. BAY1663]EXF46427.1 type IV pilus modification protein PilV [Pseudomonas sp. BAY1663]